MFFENDIMIFCSVLRLSLRKIILEWRKSNFWTKRELNQAIIVTHSIIWQIVFWYGDIVLTTDFWLNARLLTFIQCIASSWTQERILCIKINIFRCVFLIAFQTNFFQINFWATIGHYEFFFLLALMLWLLLNDDFFCTFQKAAKGSLFLIQNWKVLNRVWKAH